MSQEDVERQLQEIRVRQQSLVRAHAQAEATLDGLSAKRDDILGKLKSLGVTPQTAAQRISELETEITSNLEAINEKIG